MKLKSGKDLSQLEIMKRLNTMGIKYNPDIIGKNYYINLYDEAIQSNSNLMKIKTDLNKDKMHTDFFNQKLRKVNVCSLRICEKSNNICKDYLSSNNLVSRKNNSQKGFFSDFNGSLINKILIAQLSCDFLDANKEYIDNIKINIPKINIPFQAIKKDTLINIYPEIVKKLNTILDILNDLLAEKFILISIITFVILIIIILLIFHRRKKNNRK